MSGKTWLVGIDGSDVAYKALRLATMLMDPYEDQIKVLHLSDPQKEDPSAHPDTLMNNAEVELRRAQVGRTKWSIEHQTLRALRPPALYAVDLFTPIAAHAGNLPDPNRRRG